GPAEREAPPKRARAEPQILCEVAQPGQPPHVPRLLRDRRPIAGSTRRVGLVVVRTSTGRPNVTLQHPAMNLERFGELSSRSVAAPPDDRAANQGLHGRSP